MGVSAVKMNIGNFTGLTDEIISGLTNVINSGIQLNIENDQTTQNGSSKNIINFLVVAQENKLDIKFVFDLGNWRFVDENEQSVAAKINQYVRYIHVKNVSQENGKTSVVALDKGIIDWQKNVERFTN